MADRPKSSQSDARTAESIIDEEPSGAGAIMSYLSLHLPSWGTSVLFHAALILLCIFVVWQERTAQLDADYDLGVVDTASLKPYNRPLLQNTTQDPRSVTPDPTALTPDKRPDMPAGSPMDPIAVPITESDRTAGIESTGTSGFMGIPSGSGGGDGATRIIYVIDSSGSMTDSMDYVKAELKRSIGELNEQVAFHVIFFSAGKPIEMPTRRLVFATPAHKNMAYKFINDIVATSPLYQGEGTNPTEALERAFKLRPQLIYFLTDGEFDKTVVDLIKRWNSGQRVCVNTISFVYRSGEQLLKQIATENNGIYKFISDEDLATLFR